MKLLLILLTGFSLLHTSPARAQAGTEYAAGLALSGGIAKKVGGKLSTVTDKNLETVGASIDAAAGVNDKSQNSITPNRNPAQNQSRDIVFP